MATKPRQIALEELLARQELEMADTRAKLKAIAETPDNVKLAQELHTHMCPSNDSSFEGFYPCDLDKKWSGDDDEAQTYQRKANELLLHNNFTTAMEIAKIIFS